MAEPLRQVQADLSVTLEAGRTLALPGRNGSGKTTLVDTLVGVTRRDAGSIRLAGRDIHGLPVHQRAAAVARPGRWTEARVFELFPRLVERRKNLGNQLSGGEQQMLAFGRALVPNPRRLLLDEPLEGLAPIIVEELRRAIRRIGREDGLSAIVVEQPPHRVLGVTEDAIVPDRGASPAAPAAKPCPPTRRRWTPGSASAPTDRPTDPPARTHQETP